jgi:hypothetical protein
MTRYTVLWDPEVEAAFLAAWMACGSQSRQILTEVADWIDLHLATDPERIGLERPDIGVRIVAVPVEETTARVSATFQVLPEDRQVRVVRLVFRF